MSLNVLSTILIAILGPLLLAALHWLIKRSRPVALTVTGGSIRPVRWLAWLWILLLAPLSFSMAFQAFAAVDWQSTVLFAVLSVFMAVCGACAIPALTDKHVVHWDNEGIEGPSKRFGLSLDSARTKIAWPEIVATGRVWTGYSYVQSSDGRRIYWAAYYAGYPRLTDAIARHRQTLALPSAADFL